MAEDFIRVSDGLKIPPSELKFRFSRSGGPGGQNVNRRDTRVELLFDVANSPSLGPRQRARLLEKLSGRIDSAGVLHLEASEERSQLRNRTLVTQRFCELVEQALRRPKARRATAPSRAARERRLKEKKERSRVKRERSWKPDA